MKRFSLSLYLVLGCLVFSPSVGETQEIKSNPSGFSVGLGILGTAVTFEDSDAESGGGLGLQVGYGFGRMLTLFASADASKIKFEDPDIDGEYTLAHFDLGARLNFGGPMSSFVPYVEGAYTGRAATSTIDFGSSGSGDIELTGTAFTVGGGLNYFVDPNLAFDFGIRWSSGDFDTVKFEGQDTGDTFEAKSLRLKIGATWFPFSK